MTSREKFEAWVSDNGKFQRALECKGGIYLLATINTQWEAWQAASEASEQQLLDMSVQLANAESKCRELAAELHSVKSAHQDAVDTIMNTASKGVVIYTEKPIQMSVATPIHDAYLAEVRAQGVEMAMEHMQSSGSLTFGDCYISLNEFAAQLRQEAAQ